MQARSKRTGRIRPALGTISLATFALVGAAACDNVMPQSGLDDPQIRGGGANGADGGTTTHPPGSTAVTGIPCDIDKVLKEDCQTCHSNPTKFGASAPLVTWDDLQKPWANGKKVYELVAARIADDARPMPPSPAERLTPDEVSRIQKWVADGAKASSEACSTEPKPTGGPEPLPCTPDTTLKAATPYTLPQGQLDQYVCFGVDVTVSKKKHVIAMGPKVDNTKILHHILVFQTNEAYSKTPIPCESFGSSAWKMVTGWAPGGKNLVMPPEAGYPEETGTTHWVVQLHYNNAQNLAGEVDQSGFDLCTTEQLRPNDAGVTAFGSVRFSLPPRAQTTVKCDYRLGSDWEGKTFFGASPHMHKFGTHMSLERLPGGNGAPESVIDKVFDFQNQVAYPISAKVHSGDVMRSRCTYKNSGDTNVGFGEATGDEMCFDFVSYYPAIPDNVVDLPIIGSIPLQTWVTPSAFSSCSNE